MTEDMQFFQGNAICKYMKIKKMITQSKSDFTELQQTQKTNKKPTSLKIEEI